MKKCGKCQSSYYCSKECQHQDWPIHKRICYSSDEFSGLSAQFEHISGKTIDKTPICCMICGATEDDSELLERDTYRVCVPCMAGLKEIYSDQLENEQHTRASRSSATSSKPIYVVEPYASLSRSLSDDVYKSDVEAIKKLVLELRGSVDEVKMHRYKAYTIYDYESIIAGLDSSSIDLNTLEDKFISAFRLVKRSINNPNINPLGYMVFVDGRLSELSSVVEDAKDKLSDILTVEVKGFNIKLEEVNIYFISNGSDDWEEEEFCVVMKKEDYDNRHFQTKFAY